MWCATRPQALAGTSPDQAALRLDAASYPHKGASPRPSRPYVDNPTNTVSFNRLGSLFSNQQEGSSSSWNSLQTKPLGHPADHTFNDPPPLKWSDLNYVF